jgi:uncharacterized membrane protein YvbJ
MIKCPTCGKDLADNALTCPNCGERRLRRRSWGDRFGIAAFAISLANIFFTSLMFIPLFGIAFYYMSMFLSLSAIVFAIVGVKNATARGRIIAAFVIAIIEFLVAILYLLLIILAISSFQSMT